MQRLGNRGVLGIFDEHHVARIVGVEWAKWREIEKQDGEVTGFCSPWDRFLFLFLVRAEEGLNILTELH